MLHLASTLGRSFRRLGATKLRFAISVCLCVLAWMTLFSALDELRDIRLQRERASQLFSYPAYRLQLERLHDGSGRRRSARLPSGLVNAALNSVPIAILKTSTGISISNLARTRVLKGELYFYRNTSDGRSPTRGDFSSCSVLSEKTDFKAGSLLVVEPDWRCQMTPLVPGLEALRAEVLERAILFPFSAVRQIQGPSIFDEIDTLWIGTSNQAIVGQLVDLAQNRYGLKLIAQPLNVDGTATIADLSRATKLYCGAALIGIILGLALHIGALARPWHREMALRVCIGQPLRYLVAWILVEVVAQSGVLVFLSATAGLCLHVRWDSWTGVELQGVMIGFGFLAVLTLSFPIAAASAAAAARNQSIVKALRS